MEVTMRKAEPLAEGVWETDVEPGDLMIFGRTAQESGSISVLLVTGDVTTGEDSTLRFDHRHTQILNRGHSDRTLVVAGGHGPAGSHGPAPELASPGDQRFLAALAVDRDLRQIGSRLLAGVRAKSPGTLRYTPTRYVETEPDNFWAVKIQPRLRALEITIKGRPASSPADLAIVEDRRPYWKFKINSVSQVDSAVEVILKARRSV
jgi:hypothetical protein